MPIDAALAFAVSDAWLVEAIVQVHARHGRSIQVGLCGSQGSGKSTTAGRLQARLGYSGLRVAVCSLDDFYLTRAERQRLARDVHPLLATRGVPGTHDVMLMAETLTALLDADRNESVAIPRFDKTMDDRCAHADWRKVKGPVDVAILEGWCVGARPQPAAALANPVNQLERGEDVDGRWRRWVNDRLGPDYATVFDRLDLRVMLRAPSFECVHNWRTEQETKLARGAASRPAMTADELTYFIAHYERITQWLLESEPADLIVALNSAREPISWRIRSGA